MEPGVLLPYPHQPTTLPYRSQINVIHILQFCLWSNLILSSPLLLGLRRMLFPSVYPIKTQHIFLFSPNALPGSSSSVSSSYWHINEMRFHHWNVVHKFSISVLEVPVPFQSILTKVVYSSPHFQAVICSYSSRPTLREGRGASFLTVITQSIFMTPPPSTYMLQSLYRYLVKK